MQLRRALHPDRAIPCMDRTAHQVDRQGDHEQRDHQRAADEVDEERDRRQREDVVRDVATEDRIDRAEGRPVDELHQRAPLRRRGCRESDGEERREGQRQEAGELREEALAHLDPALRQHLHRLHHLLDPTQRDPRVAVDHGEPTESGQQPQPAAGKELQKEYAFEPDLTEPEPIRELDRQHPGEQEQHNDGDKDDRRPPGGAVRWQGLVHLRGDERKG